MATALIFVQQHAATAPIAAQDSSSLRSENRLPTPSALAPGDYFARAGSVVSSREMAQHVLLDASRTNANLTDVIFDFAGVDVLGPSAAREFLREYPHAEARNMRSAVLAVWMDAQMEVA